MIKNNNQKKNSKNSKNSKNPKNEIKPKEKNLLNQKREFCKNENKNNIK